MAWSSGIPGLLGVDPSQVARTVIFMSCRPVAPDIEHALRSTSLDPRNKSQIFAVAPGSGINSQSLPDVTQEAVIVVSPQDMALIFGPTLWRKGFLPPDASHAVPTPPPVGSSGNRSTPGISATRSFSTSIWRMAHSGLQGASSPLFRRVILPISVYRTQPCLFRLASNVVGAVPRWFRLSVRGTSSSRPRMLRSAAVVLGFAGIRGFIVSSLNSVPHAPSVLGL